MESIFQAWFDGHTQIASFWDKSSANDFAQQCKDEVQADIIEIEEVPLIDRHGFPVQRKDTHLVG